MRSIQNDIVEKIKSLVYKIIIHKVLFRIKIYNIKNSDQVNSK